MKAGILAFAAFLAFWLLPILAGSAHLPEAIDARSLGTLIGEVLSYYSELIQALMRQLH